uniref:Putative secreted protein n=1 Tax=Anopheles darlingi TaxID=43151 RepID=A0A2M4DLV9_ANODA
MAWPAVVVVVVVGGLLMPSNRCHFAGSVISHIFLPLSKTIRECHKKRKPRRSLIFTSTTTTLARRVVDRTV